MGGGDVGKTTILDAVGLLLSPVNSTTLSDTDYYATGHRCRLCHRGHCLAAIQQQYPSSIKTRLAMGVETGKEASVPHAGDDDDHQDGERQRTRLPTCGSAAPKDQELSYEIVQPDGSTDPFPVALRRSIGLVRLSGDDRNDRDLRLVQGSALDRLLSDKGLRARMGSELAKREVKSELSDAAQEALTKLDAAFTSKNLPTGLDLAITGGQGPSHRFSDRTDRRPWRYSASIGELGCGHQAAFGAGDCGAEPGGETPITIVDEVERGLEPYRQRLLVEKLQVAKAQVFLTTHSPAALFPAASKAPASGTSITPAPSARSMLRKSRSTAPMHPETFLYPVGCCCRRRNGKRLYFAPAGTRSEI